MTEEIIFNASVNTGDTVNDLNAITQANERVSDSAQAVGKDYAKALADIKAKVDSGLLTQRELTRAVREYQTVALQAGETSVVGQQAIAEAGALTDRLGDLSAQVNVLSHDGANMQASLQLASTVTAGYGAFQGVLALTGNQSEALEETMVRLNAIQLVLTSTEQIRASLEAESFLMVKARIIVTNLLSGAYQRQIVSLFSLSGVTTLWTTITAGASTAMGVLNAIMLANPALLIVAGIAALVGALAFFSSSAETAEEDNERLNDSLERSNQLLDEGNEKMIRTANNRLKLAQAEGASEEELLKLKIDNLKAEEIARINSSNKALADIRARVKVLNTAIKEQNGDVIEASQKEIEELGKKYKKLKQLDGQYYQDKRVLVTEFATKERKEAEKQTEEDAQKAEQVRKDQAQKAKENAEKRLAKQKEEEQKRLDLEKTITDLAVANIQDEWQRKFTILAVNQEREREELKKKYGANTELELQLKEKQKNELLTLDDEQAKVEREKLDKITQEKKDREQTDRVAELEGRLIQMKGEFEAEMEIKEELAIVERDRLLANQELTDGERFKIEQEFNAKMIALDDERTAEDIKNAEATLQARKELANGVTTILGNLTQLAKKNSATQKALAIADIAFQTATGFMDGLRLAQKAAIETPTPVGKALVFGSFITSQFLAVKNAVNKAKEAIGGGVTSVSPPSTSGGGASFGGAENGNDGTGLGTNTTTNTNTLNNGINTPILVVDSLSKVINQNTQAIEVATRG